MIKADCHHLLYALYGIWHQHNANISARLDNDWNYIS